MHMGSLSIVLIVWRPRFEKAFWQVNNHFEMHHGANDVTYISSLLEFISGLLSSQRRAGSSKRVAFKACWICKPFFKLNQMIYLWKAWQ